MGDREAVSQQPEKIRLDVLLAERGLVDSREAGRRLIMAGEVLVNDQLVIKPGVRVRFDAEIQLKSKPRFVSRGGDKLAAALGRFEVNPTGWVCADVGASTGGFTDCLLRSGAAKVYAIDVGYGQLSWSLRQDDRVVVMERVNARHLDQLPEQVDFVCMDVSFISVELLLPILRNWLSPVGQVVALVKPQFEAGRDKVGKGGVVRDPETHRQVLRKVITSACQEGFTIRGLIPSPLRGPAGNVEFLLWFDVSTRPVMIETETQIDEAVNEAHAQSEN